MNIPIRLLFLTTAAVTLATATDTRTWSSADYGDFSKGDAKRLSISSDGRIRLAPAFHEVLDSSSVYLWARAAGAQGPREGGGGGARGGGGGGGVGGGGGGARAGGGGRPPPRGARGWPHTRGGPE